MHVVSHPEADQELEAAALWYEERQLDLGGHFVEEFESTLRRIMAEPERWRRIREGNGVLVRNCVSLHDQTLIPPCPGAVLPQPGFQITPSSGGKSGLTAPAPLIQAFV